MGRKRASMHFTYDASTDSLGIELVPGAKSARTRRVARDVRSDFDARGRLVSLEILNASRHYAADALAELGSPDIWLTLVEAAEEAGLSPATLRKQIHNERIAAQKRGRDWYVARHELWNYLETRDARGRRAAAVNER